MERLSEIQRQTNEQTQQHIDQVVTLITRVVIELGKRAANHDKSKMCSPELDIFVEYTPKLAACTYGSDEYKQFLEGMKPALDHHYANNRHHPEYFGGYFECNGCFERWSEAPNQCPKCGYSQFTKRFYIQSMTLIDLVEMFCDWYAATKRHNDGDIMKSILINQKRFGYSDELAQILRITAAFFIDGENK